MTADVVRDILARDRRVLAAYIFGSATRGDLHRDSDLDFGLMIEDGHAMTSEELLDLSVDLSMATRFPVDLGVLSSRNLIHARQCLQTGTRVFCRDETRAGVRAASLLGMAAQLDVERREVLDAYAVS